ncbi:adipose-secreted signaling protein isoform X1 [Calliopsis andreniformis]|uniref:adipose-secreted signaling protein isoform X1 n=1 Tax=Calliopsis andreniformis TaxID=337506 RepID=UPI003FCEE4EB
MGDKEHHVHFSGGSGLGKDNNIMIQPQRHGQIDAHLGFLQLHRRYHVEFSVPWNLCIHGDGKPLEPAIVTGTHNPNCHIIDLAQEKDGLRLKVELLAYKEKILKEEVQIMCCKAGTPLTIQLNARVLGKDKGTPLLRNGIRSIAVEVSDEDEVLGTKLRASLNMQSRQKL